MDMALTGRMMDALEAERASLVSCVVPLAGLMDEALAAALVICGFGQVAVMAAKETVNRAFESSLSDALIRRSNECQLSRVSNANSSVLVSENKPAAPPTSIIRFHEWALTTLGIRTNGCDDSKWSPKAC